MCDGVPCGYACVEDCEEDVHVRELVVMPEFQGRGVGTSVLRAAVERARARGVRVFLGTFHLNRAAGLYRRLGFREIGRTPMHILFDGKGDED